MPIVLNGSGTVTGISVGGLPDGIIQSADLASGVGGKIVQVVAGTAKTASFSTTSTSDVQVTGLTCQITPTSASNKILVHLQCGSISHSDSNGSATFLKLYKDGSILSVAVGPSSGNKSRSSFGFRAGGGTGIHTSGSCLCLDSPNTTSQIEYQVYMNVEQATGYMNSTASNNDHNSNPSTFSQIVCMEVAA